MEQRHDGHEWTERKQNVIGALRAGLEGARSFLDRMETSPAPEAAPPIEGDRRRRRFHAARLAALGAAAALELLARREGNRRRPKRRIVSGVVKRAALVAAGVGIGKLIAAKR